MKWENRETKKCGRLLGESRPRATRSGDGEGWGRDRVAYLLVQRELAVSGTGRGSPSATHTFGSDWD
jgi:hypothetical protein